MEFWEVLKNVDYANIVVNRSVYLSIHKGQTIDYLYYVTRTENRLRTRVTMRVVFFWFFFDLMSDDVRTS